MIEAIKEAIWLKGISKELSMCEGRVTVYCDNQSTIYLAKNHVYHERSKHIDIRLRFVRDIIAAGEVQVEKIPTEENPSYMMTKPLSTTKFGHCLDLINMNNC